MNIQTGGKVSGVYGIKVLRNADTDKEHLEDFGESPNMLLDGFFERFASGDLSPSSWYMFVGSGTTPVDATQTQLVSQVGSYEQISATSNDNVKVGNDYIASSTGIAEWSIGAIVGNISEVGARLGTLIGSTVDSRALIVDSQGNPTTITVTAEDKLVISYTLKYIIPTQQHVSVVDFAGVQTTCTLETINALSKYSWDFYSALAIFAGILNYSGTQELVNNPELGETSSFDRSSISITYSEPSTGVRRVSFFASIEDCNEPLGLKYLATSGVASYTYRALGIHFDPPILKDNTKTLTLNFDFTLTRA
ncbi:hypothetical protein [Pseudoalteromonas sp. TB41]|uniref:hypothetical protein n=1 Tax=Pseudoalteromonas sp. TB41 TaxID=985149 RepID=UPI0004068B9F|nr:hypothetical protein [Pseudoalteromonas sp. TB41]